MDKILRNKKYIAIFAGPSLMVFAVTFVYPIIYTFVSGFYSWDGIANKTFIGLQNFIKIFTDDPIFWKSIINTIVCVLMSVFIQLPIAFLLAFLLSQKLRGSVFFRKIFFIPVILSTTMVSVLWMKIYDSQNGLLNAALNILGLGRFAKEWLADPSTVLPCAFLSAVWQFLGNHMLIMYSGMQSISSTYYEAAQIDGASKFCILRNITLPLMSNVIKVCVVLAIIGSLKAFDSVYIMTGGGPYNSSMTLALWMYLKAFRRMEYGYGSALAVLLVLICMLISWVINSLFGKKSVEY